MLSDTFWPREREEARRGERDVDASSPPPDDDEALRPPPCGRPTSCAASLSHRGVSMDEVATAACVGTCSAASFSHRGVSIDDDAADDDAAAAPAAPAPAVACSGIGDGAPPPASISFSCASMAASCESI